MENLYLLLHNRCETSPEDTIIELDDREISGREALSGTNRCASLFKKRGISRGDRVLLNLGNGQDFLRAYFGACQVGAVPVLTNPAARRFELEHICRETEPLLVITSSRSLKHFRHDEEFFVPWENILLIDGEDTGNHFSRLLEDETELQGHERLPGDHPAAIIFTSAMDGYPLGAVLTHGGITGSASSPGFTDEVELTFLAVLPLFHSFGLTATVMIPLAHGHRIRLMERFVPETFIETLTSGQVTTLSAVPLMYRIVNDTVPKGTRFPAMRQWIVGGEKIDVSLLEEMKMKYDIDLRQGYGLTEASPIVTWNRQDVENRFGSIGKAMEYNRVIIADEDGRELPPGREGEILVKGINVVKEYYNRPEKTAEYIREGWFHTGDMGKVDEDGYYYITGRKKDMIIRFGLNVYPKEVERILGYHPDVEDVSVTPCFGREETLEARVRVKQGKSLDQQRMRNWCRRNISFYKIPETFIFTG
jgi:long-chain acyl-CoA synthetase